MGPIKKKRSFWVKYKEKHEKTDQWRHLANERRTELNKKELYS